MQDDEVFNVKAKIKRRDKVRYH